MQTAQNSTMQVNFTCYTNGRGYWSDVAKDVRVTAVEVTEFDEVRVYFSTDSWDVNKQGLIYTDTLFAAQVKRELIKAGFDKRIANAMHYSEQGMQGDDYVSFDAYI